jgi:Glutathione synthase/Ribosomal protein S6 modification enzyme (glutaminyl transferase)
MILLAGIPSEAPMAMVANALEDLGYPYMTWNQRRVAESCLDFEIKNGAIEGTLTLDGTSVNLNSITGVYVRLMDDSQLPELRDLPGDAQERNYSRAQHEGLLVWLNLATARVANRPAANASNCSKPWQTRLIDTIGLRTPETLVTNDPTAVCQFRQQHGELIYKSASACRSVVKTFCDNDERRLDAIRWCPVQFQRRVRGCDVRVHVVGSEVFATRIDSSAVDYRYATRDGLDAKLVPFELSPELADTCRTLSNALDLPFAGIDLRIEEDGSAWCFEVNPCPGFSYYESHTGQPIAAAVARYLMGSQEPAGGAPTSLVIPTAAQDIPSGARQ